MEKSNNKKQIKLPVLKSLTEVLQHAAKEGYTHDLMVRDGYLIVKDEEDKKYKPEQISITNFYRFEGMSDPEDSSILYLIETHDGIKGTLADAYGAYSDAQVNEFMKKVDDIHKKVDR